MTHPAESLTVVPFPKSFTPCISTLGKIEKRIVCCKVNTFKEE